MGDSWHEVLGQDEPGGGRSRSSLGRALKSIIGLNRFHRNNILLGAALGIFLIIGISCLVTLYTLSHPCSPDLQNNTSVGQGFWFILGSQPGQETEQEVKEVKEAKEAKQDIEV